MNKKLAGVIITVIALGGLGFVYVHNKPDDQSAQTETVKSDEEILQDNTESGKKFKAEEVAMHSTKEDCWTIVEDHVYDITEFVSQHPGGDEILRACGVDATTLFQSRTTESGEEVGTGTPHSSSAKSQLESFEIGHLQ